MEDAAGENQRAVAIALWNSHIEVGSCSGKILQFYAYLLFFNILMVILLFFLVLQYIHIH